MKFLEITLLMATIFIIGCNGGKPTPPKPATDYDQIKATYENYKAALLADDGRKMMNFIDEASKKYYQQLLTYAQKADSTGIADSGLAEKMTILLARQVIPRDELSKMDLAGFFDTIVKKGMIGKSSVKEVNLGDIVINGTEANAAMFIKGKQLQYDFRFANENNEWKLDLVRMLQIASVGFQQELDTGDMTSNEYVLRSIQIMSGKLVDKDIWSPVE